MAKDQMTRLDEQIGHLEDTVAKEFLEIRNRFDAVDRRFEAVDRRLDSVDRRLDSIDARLDKFQSTVKNAFEVQHDRLGELEKTVNQGFRDIGSRIDKLASRRPRRGKRRT